ncbi:MAG: alkaline phosphatase D family protein [Luteolibacter sp.]
MGTHDLTRRSFLKTAAAGGFGLASGLLPGASLAREVPLKDGSLEVSLQLLNLWGKKPEKVNALFSAIYNALATSPAADFRTVSQNEEVRRLCGELGIVHLGGPMLGCLQKDGASVWVRTLQPAEVTVVATVNGAEKTYGPVKTSHETDLTAVVKVNGLPAGTSTPYKVLVDGREIPVPRNAAITTCAMGGDALTRITFGTCQHRWGLGNERQTGTILGRKPHAMLMYGDIAVQDRMTDFGMHRADYALRDFHPAWRDLVAAVPVYASWDDHDYLDNDKWGCPPGGDEQAHLGLRKVFSQAWNNPYYGLGDSGGGIFQHTRIGPCDIIMTDNRYFRTATGKHCFLGPEQMAWLKKTLRACRGPFIIMSCGTMWSDYVSGGKDSWGKFDPEGREEIFRLIEEEKISGVLLISGDRHGARGFTIPRPSGFKFYEFEPASLGGRHGPPPTNPRWQTQLFGITSTYAFGEFTFDLSKTDPEVTFRLVHSEENRIIHELTLKRSQLTPA